MPNSQPSDKGGSGGPSPHRVAEATPLPPTLPLPASRSPHDQRRWQQPPPALPPAPRRIGKYLVQSELGRGGMGAVYLALEEGTQARVAIKELVVSKAADPSAMTRFGQEARVMARIDHPNIVRVIDLERSEEARYIILEYVEGATLRRLLGPEAMPLAQVFAIMNGVLGGLQHAHRNSIVHRDVKPENILVALSGEVKVADFGVARLTDDTGLTSATRTGTTVGTPQYMSPEQVMSSRVDARSDLYSAGVILYELVCGSPPFTALPSEGPFGLMAKHAQAAPPPPGLHRPGLDQALEQLILRALAKSPDQRFQTGSQFQEALAEVADRLTPGWRESLRPGADLAAMLALTPPPPARPSVAADEDEKGPAGWRGWLSGWAGLVALLVLVALSILFILSR